MKLALVTVGTRGDVDPYVALGVALQARGHQVTLAAPGVFAAHIAASGLAFAPLTFDPREVFNVMPRENPVRQLADFRSRMQSRMRAFFAETLAACEGHDAVVYGIVSFAGRHVAERLGIPSIAAFLQPATATSEHPPIMIPGQRNLGRWGNRLAFSLFDGLRAVFVRPLLDAARRDVLRLPQGDGRAPMAHLYGYSSLLSPRPTDWAHNVHVTGFWRRPERHAHTVSDAPIVVGFGSMIDRSPDALNAALQPVFSHTERSIVVVGEWSRPFRDAWPKHVRALDATDHNQLLPGAHVFVHHGGAGTTAAACLAGVRQVVVPHMADQYYWANRLHRLGVAPRALPRSQLSSRALIARLAEAQALPAPRALSEALRREDGVSIACERIEAYARA